MKVFENIERFHREDGILGSAVITDKEFQEGLATIIETVKPLRKDKDLCISEYEMVRDSSPLTVALAEKEANFFSRPNLDLAQKEVDFAVLKVIYEDRYSFGYLYWHILLKYESHDYDDHTYAYKDQDAPYKKSLIEYAIDFDLEQTLDEYNRLDNLGDKLEYALCRRRQSRNQVQIEHPIKEKYEEALRILAAGCKRELEEKGYTFTGSADSTSQAQEVSSSAGNEGITSFAIQYVTDIRNRNKLLVFLHNNIDGKRNQNALVYIQAAINVGLLDRPSYNDLKNEFGEICKDKAYYAIVKPSGGHFRQLSDKLRTIEEELRTTFK